MAQIEASRIVQGVEKSGSPTPSEMTPSIVEATSKNLRMPDGGIATMCSAGRTFDVWFEC